MQNTETYCTILMPYNCQWDRTVNQYWTILTRDAHWFLHQENLPQQTLQLAQTCYVRLPRCKRRHLFRANAHWRTTLWPDSHTILSHYIEAVQRVPYQINDHRAVDLSSWWWTWVSSCSIFIARTPSNFLRYNMKFIRNHRTSWESMGKCIANCDAFCLQIYGKIC